MLRFLVILLVLLNAIALAAWQGWFGQDGTRREPERVTNQLKPEQITVLDEAGVLALQAAQRELTPAPAPVPEPAPESPAVSVVPTPAPAPVPQACVAFAGLDDATADTLLREARAEAGFAVRDIPSTDVTSWWVHIPALPTKTAAEQRAAEIRAKGWTDLFVVGENGARPLTISLGLFKSAEAAAEQRRRIEAKGVRGVAIEERGDTTHRVEIRGPAEALIDSAGRWGERLGGGTRQDCLP
ncbi:SPOR domain-containing protein [Denitromonas iodatirespirans]|uniref:SPOR domain-containing protein n=1 Tax=Denitromonas iodatirespirans TaxID=2795389 RepID=A0A944D7D2_DENI1|nr:SPOR domain-containing protein [Denitromonas iodatirespirans]MBT0959646.1 SPOR domain-containing protein [Denitromonas iodatirespirans]